MEWVIDLDLLSFDALIASLHRNKYRNMIITINAVRIAQADKNEFKKHIQSIEKESSVTGASPATHTGKEMIAKFGRGF